MRYLILLAALWGLGCADTTAPRCTNQSFADTTVTGIPFQLEVQTCGIKVATLKDFSSL